MTEFYGRRDDKESIATIHRALELGITFFDTARYLRAAYEWELLRKSRRRMLLPDRDIRRHDGPA